MLYLVTPLQVPWLVADQPLGSWLLWTLPPSMVLRAFSASLITQYVKQLTVRTEKCVAGSIPSHTHSYVMRNANVIYEKSRVVQEVMHSP